MKNLPKMFIIVIITCLFLSCDFGLDDGSDILSGWDSTTLGILGLETTHEFYDDGTGIIVYRYSDKYSYKNKEEYFEYFIDASPGNIYNVVKLKVYDVEKNIVQDDYEVQRFNYYFNSTKDVLYVKYDDIIIWHDWGKKNYEYKDIRSELVTN